MSQQLSRRDVALILQRTAELERVRQPQTDAITADDLHKIAEELGMSREALSQALAENKAGVLAPESEQSVLDRFYGKASIDTRRFVPGDVATVRTTVERFFREQGFDIQRRGDDWMVWRRTTGTWNALKRIGLGEYRLPADVDYRVRICQLAGGPHPVLVQIEVDVSQLRSARVRNGVGSLAVGGAGAITGSIMLPMPTEIIAVVGGIAIGVAGVMKGREYFRATREKVSSALERFLDFLEHEPARFRNAPARDAFSRIADFLGLG